MIRYFLFVVAVGIYFSRRSKDTSDKKIRPALEHGEHSRFVGVSGLDMPLGNGWELLLFCHRHHPEIPALLIADESLGRHVRIESWAAGVVDRSFDFRSFRYEVERLISRAG